MESKDKLKGVDIKDCTSFYIDDIRDIDIYSGNILSDDKSYKTYKNILVYGIWKKTFRDSIPLRIRYNEIDGFMKIYYGIRYLVIFDHNQHEKIWDRIRYLISEKSGIADSINHNFPTIRIDSYNSLPIEKYWLFIML